MYILKSIVIVAAIVQLEGCGESKNKETEKKEGVIPQHQLKALEDAKGMEQTLKDSDEKRREQLE